MYLRSLSLLCIAIFALVSHAEEKVESNMNEADKVAAKEKLVKEAVANSQSREATTSSLQDDDYGEDNTDQSFHFSEWNGSEWNDSELTTGDEL